RRRATWSGIGWWPCATGRDRSLFWTPGHQSRHRGELIWIASKWLHITTSGDSRASEGACPCRKTVGRGRPSLPLRQLSGDGVDERGSLFREDEVAVLDDGEAVVEERGGVAGGDEVEGDAFGGAEE